MMPTVLDPLAEAVEARLVDRFTEIGRVMNEGVVDWERLWLELVRQYEALAEELAMDDAA